MKRVIIAPDSFKGTLSCIEVCDIVSRELKKRFDDISVTEIPVADGGEGTVEAFLHASGGSRIYCTARSPLGREIEAYYGILPDGTAVIEMAQASGISIEKENNALLASSYGTGQLISDALGRGCRKILLGIGGSATTDGGVGCVAALGGKFESADGESLSLCGEGLHKLHKIDLSELDKRLAECEVKVLCDVKNPLYGKNGAAYIYAPQKGASRSEVILLDMGLRKLAEVAEGTVGKDFSSCEGAGAAGGLGFAAVALLGAELVRGTEAVLAASCFSRKVQSADLVITGEGKLDKQSLMGKVPFEIARKSGGKRVVAIVGVSEITHREAAVHGISEIIETNPEKLPFESVKVLAEEMLIAAVKKMEL